MTLNRNLFETALRHLLVDSADYMVQLFEGSGSHWKKTRCVQLHIKRSTARHNELIVHAISRHAAPVHCLSGYHQRDWSAMASYHHALSWAVQKSSCLAA